MKRWDCCWVAQYEGEVVVTVKVHGKPVSLGPWVIPVQGVLSIEIAIVMSNNLSLLIPR
jgi:hypothetical protein